MDWWGVVQIVVGALITISVVVFVEYWRKPRLSLEIADTEDAKWKDTNGTRYPAHKARWLRVKVENKQLPRWAKWLSRNVASHCHGLITFYHLVDGQNVFGRSMQVRWFGPREPLPILVVAKGLPPMQILDPVRLTPEIHRAVYSGESEKLDVAVRFDNDAECYGWCDDNYRSDPLWRNPKWKLEKGRYLVKVTVMSSGTKCCDVFRLINDVSVDAFGLKKATPDDYKKIFSKTPK